MGHGGARGPHAGVQDPTGVGAGNEGGAGHVGGPGTRVGGVRDPTRGAGTLGLGCRTPAPLSPNCAASTTCPFPAPAREAAPPLKGQCPPWRPHQFLSPPREGVGSPKFTAGCSLRREEPFGESGRRWTRGGGRRPRCSVRGVVALLNPPHPPRGSAGRRRGPVSWGHMAGPGGHRGSCRGTGGGGGAGRGELG